MITVKQNTQQQTLTAPIMALLLLWTIAATAFAYSAIQYSTQPIQHPPDYQAVKTVTTSIKHAPDQPQNIQQRKTSKLHHVIAQQYNIPLNTVQHIVVIVEQHTEHPKHAWPDTKTVLAIIAVESRFKQNANSGTGKGLMQLTKTSGKNTSIDPRSNIRNGIALLREYYAILGNRDKAIMAYNIGIGALKRGGTAKEYLNKVKHARSRLTSNQA